MVGGRCGSYDLSVLAGALDLGVLVGTTTNVVVHVHNSHDWAAWMGAIAGVVVATASVVTAAVVIRTARLARETLDDARRTRHAQLIVQISQRWDDPEIIRSSRLAAEHSASGIVELVNRLYAPKPRFETRRSYRRTRARDLERYFEVFLWPNLLETLGCLLMQEEAINMDSVYHLWGAEIIGTWEDIYKEPIYRLRRLQKDEGIYSYFEKLAGALAPIHRARVATLDS